MHIYLIYWRYEYLCFSHSKQSRMQKRKNSDKSFLPKSSSLFSFSLDLHQFSCIYSSFFLQIKVDQVTTSSQHILSGSLRKYQVTIQH